MPKIKGSQVNFCNTVVKGPQRKPKLALSLVKMVDHDVYVENFSPFSLYASNNLVHIFLQWGTFHAHYTNPKN